MAVTIARIEYARLPGRRPRLAGCNARLGVHGQDLFCSLARLTASDGAQGFGWSAMTREDADALLGQAIPDDLRQGVPVALRAVEYPLLDLAAKRAGQPVYAYVARRPATGPLFAPCYDTSLYIDDLQVADDAASAELIAQEALEGVARGHTAFKVKVGRGAMHLPLEQGTARDIAVIHAVRAAVGPDAVLMIDANNGFNVNLAKRVLAETAVDRIYWLEEAFYEDARLYAHLKEWLAHEGLATLIADGEGRAAPDLIDLARDGLVDVVQYDIRRPGFSHWLEWGPRLDAYGVSSAPHSYGDPWGNYAACHLSTAIDRFELIEWDQAVVPGLDANGYVIRGGQVTVPTAPGFGLTLDEGLFRQAAVEGGWEVAR
jgi:L-alanine-DL-glutamate epimerase-like enolase superfamily enzyme